MADLLPARRIAVRAHRGVALCAAVLLAPTSTVSAQAAPAVPTSTVSAESGVSEPPASLPVSAQPAAAAAAVAVAGAPGASERHAPMRSRVASSDGAGIAAPATRPGVRLPPDPCAAPDSAALSASRELYCIELVAHPDVPGASGVVSLERASSPFGVAATADGRLIYETTLTLDGLPRPETLGPYATYVAWAAPPLLDPVVKLGEVGNGRSVAGRIAFDRFLVFVTAEPSADVEEQTGPLVLRGMSAGMQMSDTHLLGMGMGGAGRRAGDARADSVRGAGAQPDHAPDRGHAGAHGHAQAGGHAASAGEWTMPPMNPRVAPMPMGGLEGAVPSATPFLPGRDVDASTLPEARPRTVVELADGDTLELVAERVRRTISGRTFVMYGFNGQYPGPLIQVEEDAEIVVLFENRIEWPTSVHWHGIRIENRFDGVPGVTQEPVEPGETFVYRVRFPDAGIYWYHPHHREEVQQDLGLYGNMLVRPDEADYYGPAHRDEVLMLDDLLLGEAGLVPYGRERATHAVMGRFGNLLLVNGEPEYRLEVDEGEVVRFHLTNVSNVRTFNLSFDGNATGLAGPNPGSGAGSGAGAEGTGGARARVLGAASVASDDSRRGSAYARPAREAAAPVPAGRGVGADAPVRMKVVATDVGRFEREEWVESVVIAPAERYVIDVRFEEAGEYALVNRVHAMDHAADRFFAAADTLGRVRVSTEPAAPDLAGAFDTLRTNAAVIREIERSRAHFDGPPDHELVLTLENEGLPFALEQMMVAEATGYVHPLEWTGTMPMMDWLPTGGEARWVLREPSTGRENMAIRWRFDVGDRVRIRIHNERRALHPMQHPIHIHGQRFLVLAVNGVPNENLAWKDTVLVPVGGTVDLLLELTNPGDWMLHCHIAEHLEAGMKMLFSVDGEWGATAQP